MFMFEVAGCGLQSENFAPTLKGEFSLGWCLCLTLRVAGMKIFASTLKGEFSSVGVYV